MSTLLDALYSDGWMLCLLAKGYTRSEAITLAQEQDPSVLVIPVRLDRTTAAVLSSMPHYVYFVPFDLTLVRSLPSIFD